MAGMLRLLQGRVQTTYKWITKNPRKSTCIGIICGSPLINWYLKNKAAKELKLPVYKTLMEHSKLPLPLDSTIIIPRPGVLANLKNMCLTKKEDTTKTRFGVVIGPSGCGKTSAIRGLCTEYSEGVIYHEVVEPASFVSNLSRVRYEGRASNGI